MSYNSPGSARPQAAVGTVPAAFMNEPPALKGTLRRGFRITKSFAAASGLTGWVVQDSDGQYSVLFTTPDGQTEIDGDLVTASGEDLTQRYIAQYVPKPDLTALWTKFGRSSFVNTGAHGNPKATIYVIMDPNCIFCHMLWIALKPYEAAGLQVRWIPVGFLQQDSPGKAAALLNGGEAVLTRMQEGFDERLESAGGSGINVTPDLKARLDANLALMREAQMQGTPGIFYKDSAGHVRYQDGMPTLPELPSITGIPSQSEPDARLARFRK
jgi:thiol:disulfide interchange protein DsbG